ncbi:hypothetical protein V8D89_003495 [Ganoderma adspersum]
MPVDIRHPPEGLPASSAYSLADKLLTQLLRKVFAPLPVHLQHFHGRRTLPASCIGTRVRMGFLYGKPIAGVFDHPRLGIRDAIISKESSLKGLVTDARLPYPSATPPAEPSRTLIISPEVNGKRKRTAGTSDGGSTPHPGCIIRTSVAAALSLGGWSLRTDHPATSTRTFGRLIRSDKELYGRRHFGQIKDGERLLPKRNRPPESTGAQRAQEFATDGAV